MLHAVQPGPDDLGTGGQVGEQRRYVVLVLLHQGGELFRGIHAAVQHGPQVGVGGLQGLGKVSEIGGKAPDRATGFPLGGEHLGAVLQQPDGLVQMVVGGFDQVVTRVDDPGQVVSGPGEGIPELVHHGNQVALRHRVDQLVQVVDQLMSGERDRGTVPADHRILLVGEVRAAFSAGREVHVLFADRGPVRDRRGGVVRDPGLGFQQHGDLDAIPGGAETFHLADGDAVVRDLRAFEDPAGVGEVRPYSVPVAEQFVTNTGVVHPGNRYADHRQHQENGELNSYHSGSDHRTPPSNSRASSGS